MEETEGYIGLLVLRSRIAELAKLIEQWRHELPEEFAVRAEGLLSEEAERDV
ncbi:hypothetical protein FACS1894167_02080 [Synergistales bacterium]|nr:hypothetical protein FACS1894167_02080 [Synergistales bacterium]GHV49745.1 hypothetical protein FACS1894216_00700 [Synergistales bacterium]